MTILHIMRSPRVLLSCVYAIGWFASAYLLYVYVTGGPIACGVGQGCDVVRASRWAYVGGIPQPLFGVVFYTGMIALLIVRSTTSAYERLLFRLIRIGAIIGFLDSVALFLVQWIDVQAFCTWCLVSGASATIGCALTMFDKPSLTSEQREADLLGHAITLGALVFVGVPAFLLLVR